VTVSTRLLLPSPAHSLCLTARFATRDEQRLNNTKGVTVDRTTSSSCGVPVTAGRLSVRSCQGVPHLATGDLRPSINCFRPAVVHSRLRIG
jgi:hypothetical protein